MPPSGMDLYNGKAGCIACHNGALASDEKVLSHRRSGRSRKFLRGSPAAGHLPLGGSIRRRLREVIAIAADDQGLYHDQARCRHRSVVAHPMLRELKWTGPYMHNGMLRPRRRRRDFFAQTRAADRG